MEQAVGGIIRVLDLRVLEVVTRALANDDSDQGMMMESHIVVSQGVLKIHPPVAISVPLPLMRVCVATRGSHWIILRDVSLGRRRSRVNLTIPVSRSFARSEHVREVLWYSRAY